MHTLEAERLDGGGVFNHLLAKRFESPDRDGPVAYANFLANPDSEDARAQLRNQAVAVIEQVLTALGFKS